MAYQSEIEKLEQRYHENPQQWFAALADSYRKAGEVDLALEVVRGGLEKRPNYASGHIVLGRCLLDKDEAREAALAFQHVLEIDAENIIALKSLSEIAERDNDIGSATSWLQRLLEVDPMNDEALASLERLREVEASPPEMPSAAEPPVEEPRVEPGAAWAAEAMPGLGRSREDTPVVVEPDALRVEKSEDVVLGDGEVAAGEEVPTAGAFPAAPGDELEIEHLQPEPDLGAVGIGTPEVPSQTAPASWGDVSLAPEPETVGDADEHERAVVDVSWEAESELPSHEEQPPPIEPAAGYALQAQTAEPPYPVEPDAADEEVVSDLGAEVSDVASVEAGAGDAELETVPDAPHAEAPSSLGVVSFDEELGWDAGERQSHEVTEEDVAAAQAYHEETAAPVEFLGDPGAVVAEDTPEQVESDDVSGSAGVGAETVAPSLEEPEARVWPEPEVVAKGSEEAEGGLPLIMPEEIEREVEPTEPKPIVTETMAEVYANQGLYAQAVETYEKLLEQRPGDQELERRLAQLEEQARAASNDSRPSRYSASATGGLSAISYLQAVFAGQPEEHRGPPEATPTPVDGQPALLSQPPETAPPAEATWAAEPPQAPGSPTVPASDEVSLSSVFGIERPPATPQDEPPREPGTGARLEPEAGGVSFDEFYGGDGEPSTAQDPDAPEPQSEDDETTDEGFKDWLESLKT